MIRVQAEDFDVGIELSKMTDENFGIGAQSCFIGLVRDMANEEHISAMTLEHYPEMTKKTLEDICIKAKKKWKIIDLIVAHRYGTININDNIVFVLSLIHI